MNYKIQQWREFGNTVVVGGVFVLGFANYTCSLIQCTQIMKVFRFAFVGIPIITGITLALFILKFMSTTLEVIDID